MPRWGKSVAHDNACNCKRLSLQRAGAPILRLIAAAGRAGDPGSCWEAAGWEIARFSNGLCVQPRIRFVPPGDTAGAPWDRGLEASIGVTEDRRSWQQIIR